MTREVSEVQHDFPRRRYVVDAVHYGDSRGYEMAGIVMSLVLEYIPRSVVKVS